MSKLGVAAVQMACTWDAEHNLACAERSIRQAAARGARIVLLPELFATPYFCKDQNPDYFALATEVGRNPQLTHLQRIAAELEVVLPVSFFERAGTAYFNATAIIDADGACLGVYRKSHIPQGPGYEEKYYFTPGDTGFQVWRTRYAAIGVGICWDQWFPEAARAMALMGAEVLCYPTAIGSEPHAPALDSQAHWQRVMQGHAGANLMPLIAANRIGTEVGASCALTFYGSSFIAGPTGELVAHAGRDEEAVLNAEFDLDEIRQQRAAWGVFRDRRPELYQRLLAH